MAFCTKCGAKIDDGVRFCTSCGNAAQQAAVGGAPVVQPVNQSMTAPIQQSQINSADGIPITEDRKGQAIASLVLGILSLILGVYIIIEMLQTKADIL